MNGVNIITGKHIPDNGVHVQLHFFVAWIQISRFSIIKDPVRMLLADMIGGNRRTVMPYRFATFVFAMFRDNRSIMAQLKYSTVRITPRMKFHASFMRFSNHE